MPFRRFGELSIPVPTLERRYGLMAETLRFETNDPALLAAADASFGRVAVPVDGREPLVVSLFTEPGGSGSPGSPVADDDAWTITEVVNRTYGSRYVTTGGSRDVSVSDEPARPDGSDAAPTVTASVATPGDETVPGASPELPAATTTTFPARNAAFTAWLPASEPSDAGLPSDMEMTFTSARAAHHSIADTTLASAPEPVESSTLAATTRAPGATPA